MIIIASTLYYTGNVNYLLSLYLFLSLAALFITFRIDLWIKCYPNLTTKYKEAVEMVFEKSEYLNRLYNFIISYLFHAFIIGILIQNYSVLIAITGVLIYRVMNLVHGYHKVREHINE
jgi:prepilin signal peptidase PulO-like enzyme (type II secretory pathway)